MKSELNKDKHVYDKEGYDRRGFDREGIHRETKTRYDKKGFDKDGYNKDGYDRYGYNRDGYNKEGYNINGYDREGYNKKGYNARGFDRNGIHKGTRREYDFSGCDQFGYDKNGYDRFGFDKQGIHRDTGTRYNPLGYDVQGYHEDGYNYNGIDRRGFDRNGIHYKTNTKYDSQGYDRDGYDKDKFDRNGEHKLTRTRYDVDGFNQFGYNKNGYNRNGIHIDGYDENGYDKNGYDKNGVNKDGINRITGEKDERIKLAEEFIESGLSIRQFARSKQMSTEEVQDIIEKIRVSPCIKIDIDRTLTDNSNKYVAFLNTLKEELLSGRKTIREMSCINEILRICDPQEAKKIIEMLINAIVSHDISILEYKYLFGIDRNDSSLPQKIIIEIEKNKTFAGKMKRELYKEIDRIKQYTIPYRPCDGEKIGFFANPKAKEPVLVTITDREREMARQYLRAKGEFICNKTMQMTLLKIAKGEIDEKIIERIVKERKLRNLQQEDEKLEELIEQSKQLIGEEQRDEEEQI